MIISKPDKGTEIRSITVGIKTINKHTWTFIRHIRVSQYA